MSENPNFMPFLRCQRRGWRVWVALQGKTRVRLQRLRKLPMPNRELLPIATMPAAELRETRASLPRVLRLTNPYLPFTSKQAASRESEIPKHAAEAKLCHVRPN